MKKCNIIKKLYFSLLASIISVGAIFATTIPFVFNNQNSPMTPNEISNNITNYLDNNSNSRNITVDSSNYYIVVRNALDYNQNQQAFSNIVTTPGLRYCLPINLLPNNKTGNSKYFEWSKSSIPAWDKSQPAINSNDYFLYNLPKLNSVNPNYCSNKYFSIKNKMEFSINLFDTVLVFVGIVTPINKECSNTFSSTNKNEVTNNSMLSAPIWGSELYIGVNNAKLSIKKYSYENNNIRVDYNVWVNGNRSSAWVQHAKVSCTPTIDLSLELPDLYKMYSYLLFDHFSHKNYNFANMSYVLKPNPEKIKILYNEINNNLKSLWDKNPYSNFDKYNDIYEPRDYSTEVQLKKVRINNRLYEIPTFNFTYRDFLDIPIYDSNNNIIGYQSNYKTITFPIMTNLWLNYEEDNHVVNKLKSSIWFGEFVNGNFYQITGESIKYTSDNFIGLIKNNQLKEILLNDVINYINPYSSSSNSIKTLPINTILSRPSFEQLTFKNHQIISPNDIIDLNLNKDFNPITLLANGKMVLSFLIGENFKNAYVSGDKVLYDKWKWNEQGKSGVINSNIDGFKTQYDVYLRSNLDQIIYDNNHSIDNDRVVDVNSLLIKNIKCNINNEIKDIKDVNVEDTVNGKFYIDGNWILDNLFTFGNEDFYLEHENNLTPTDPNYKKVYKITSGNDQKAHNSIAATNLSKQDFINNVLLSKQQLAKINRNSKTNNDEVIKQEINNNIKIIYRNNVLGKILVKLNLKGTLKDLPLVHKPRTLIDMSQEDEKDRNFNLLTNENQIRNHDFYFWIDGFRKNYDFTLKINKTLDATKLYIDLNSASDKNLQKYENSLCKYTSQDILKMVNQQDPDKILLKSLIEFGDVYETSNNEVINNKLLRTRLSFYQFLKLIKYQFITDNTNLNINQTNEFNGTYNGLIHLDQNAIENNHYLGGVLFEILKYTNEAEFKINNLKRRVLIYQNSLKDEKGYFKLNSVNDLTCKDFLDLKNNQQVDISNLSNIFIDNFANLFNYNYQKEVNVLQPQAQDFNDHVLLTNASSIDVIKQAIVDKTIQFTNINFNQPMGRMEISFDVVLKNGSINDELYSTVNEQNEFVEIKKSYTLKLKGFKQQIDIDHSVITLDINQINQAYGLNINNIQAINEQFILDYLIKYHDTSLISNDFTYILNTNVTKQEFKEEILDKIVLNQTNDFSTIEGQIFLNKNLGEIVNQPENNNDHQLNTINKVINFKIINFSHQVLFRENDIKTFDINDYENLKTLNINDLNVNTIINNFILFNQSINEINSFVSFKQMLLTNISSEFFINEILDYIELNPVYSQNLLQVNIKLKPIEQLNNVVYLNQINDTYSFNIIGFNTKPNFSLNASVIYDNQLDVDQINIKSINETMILDKFMSFNDQHLSYDVMIATNLTKNDFIEHYLDKVIIVDRNYEQSTMHIKFKFKQLINGYLEFDSELKLTQSLITITNINDQFILEQGDKLASQYSLNLQQIINFIGFNNNIANSIFNINISKQAFIELLDTTQPITINDDDLLGLKTVTFHFIKPIYFVNQNNELISTKDFDITIGGFKNNITLKQNTININIDDFNIFDNVYLDQVDQKFIIDNLIKFDDNDWSNNIICSINLTKEQFLKILSNISISFNKVDETANLTLEFYFKTNINVTSDNEEYKAKNQTNTFNCSLYDDNKVLINNQKDATLAIVLGITIPLILIIIGLIAYFVWRKVRNKEEFNNELKNNL